MKQYFFFFSVTNLLDRITICGHYRYLLINDYDCKLYMPFTAHLELQEVVWHLRWPGHLTGPVQTQYQ